MTFARNKSRRIAQELAESHSFSNFAKNSRKHFGAFFLPFSFRFIILDPSLCFLLVVHRAGKELRGQLEAWVLTQ